MKMITQIHTNRNAGTGTAVRIFTTTAIANEAFGIDATGTYVIEDDTITITYEILGFEKSFDRSFAKHGDSIIIDGREFQKQ